MNEFAKLIQDLRRYEEEVYPNLDPDYSAVFASRVRELGERELLVYLFRKLADSTLRVALDMLRFAWCDLSFETWMQVLEDVADDRRFVYQFLMFASDTLAMDIRGLPSSHPNVRRELETSAFSDGGPAPQTREVRERLDDSFDYESMWRRLAREGAPMQAFSVGST
jgi:hypothetical protein